MVCREVVVVGEQVAQRGRQRVVVGREALLVGEQVGQVGNQRVVVRGQTVVVGTQRLESTVWEILG